MTTDETSTTTEREEPPPGSDDAVSDDRNLRRLEGQVSILLRNIDEQRRQVREDHRELTARLDKLFYWTLALCLAIITTVIASAIVLAIRLG